VCSGHPRAPAVRARPPQDPTQRHVTQPTQGHLPPLSSCSAGRAAIATGQAGAASALSRLPGARSPPRPHSQGCHGWSDPLSTASTAPPHPCSRPFWGSLLARDPELGIAFLLQVPSSAHSRSKWHDIPLMFQRTPNLEHTIWRRGRLSRGVGTKTPQSPLLLNQSGTLATPWMGQLHSPNYMSQQLGEDAKGHSVRTMARASSPDFWVPNPNKTRTRTH
jgi:hypothetical protein